MEREVVITITAIDVEKLDQFIHSFKKKRKIKTDEEILHTKTYKEEIKVLNFEKDQIEKCNFKFHDGGQSSFEYKHETLKNFLKESDSLIILYDISKNNSEDVEEVYYFYKNRFVFHMKKLERTVRLSSLGSQIITKQKYFQRKRYSLK
jgi:hypothetical protein